MIGLTYVCRTPREVERGHVVQGCGAGTTRLEHEAVPACPCRRPMRSLADEVAAKLAEVNVR